MRALDRKLLRDLWHVKGQALAISLVIGSGVAMFIMYLSTFHSLRLTQRAYYDRYRFADVFATLKRAPLDLRDRVAEIPGVARVDARVVVDVTLDVPGLAEPATGRLISVPVPAQPTLNDVFLRRGRHLAPGRPDEVLVSEGFAITRRLEPGDAVGAVINGRRRELRIVGIALSPEYVYSIRPGELMPDDSRFGVFWMERRALASAFNMEGAFNNVALKLLPGASESDVIARLDRLLAPYGGFGAIPRALQTSHWYLDSELSQLQGVGLIIPIIFLAVAAFLLNVVLMRIVSVQREPIAVLKALGYTNLELAAHYTKLSLAIGVAGAAIGTAGGAWLGAGMTSIYNNFFRFPILQYRLSSSVVVGAVLVSFVAAVLGAFGAVRRAVGLPPAEAMRPEPPARYHESWVERAGLKRVLAQPARMVLRNVARQPVRAASSVIGIGLAVAMLIVGTFFLDAIDVLMDTQFFVAQRHDLSVSFVEPVSARALYEIGRLPGVVHAEPLRAVPARIRFGHRSRQVAITGLLPDPQLNRVVDVSRGPLSLPPDGVVLSEKLAELVGARRDDLVTLEVLMIFFNLMFSGIIAFGVVYNAARVSLSERSRELASLRVMGFTRGEISFILLGELAVVTLIALPVGMVLGYLFAALVVTLFSNELYRFPLVVSARTYAYAASAVLVAATCSALVVRRKLDRLDLVAVLKTRE